eukprot:scaffold434_cov186-Pinguiococcus_pyrenoidosus.AAC.24
MLREATGSSRNYSVLEGLRDVLVNLALAVQVVIDERGHLAPGLEATEGRALPDPPFHVRDFLSVLVSEGKLLAFPRREGVAGRPVTS